jgi:hypothetical protein
MCSERDATQGDPGPALRTDAEHSGTDGTECCAPFTKLETPLQLEASSIETAIVRAQPALAVLVPLAARGRPDNLSR